jgi:RND family efflux transporter MFP subunit
MTNMSKGPAEATRNALPPFLSTTSQGRGLQAVPRKFIIAGGLAAIVLIAAAVIALRPAAPPPVTGAAPPVLTVTAASPRSIVWPHVIEVSGAIAPWQEAIISAQISGYQITEILANVGDQVKKGQVLARVNPALLRADEAVLVANFEQADANYKRALTLKDNGFISDQNILQLETQAKTTRALLESKRLQLRYTDIIAPDDGAVSARTATLGSVVSTGQELFRLVRQNRLEWRGELSAKQLTDVGPGQTVRLTLPNGGLATATVRQTAPTLSQDSRLAFVYADLEPNSQARAGMYATGRIAVGEGAALVVPAESVVLRDGRTYVLELKDPKADVATVVLRQVETGRREGAEVEIVSGLAEGARIAVRGSGFLNDGDAVRVVAAAPDAPK